MNVNAPIGTPVEHLIKMADGSVDIHGPLNGAAGNGDVEMCIRDRPEHF